MQLNHHRVVPWVLLFLISVISGGTFVGIEIALSGTSPAWLAAGRISIAAVVMAGIWCLSGRPVLSRCPTPAFVATLSVMALTNTVLPFMLVSWAQQHVSSGFAGISMSSVALMVVPLAHFTCPGERMNLRTVIGIGVGFLGVLSLFGSEISAANEVSQQFPARVACITAAICYASCSILVRRLGAVNPLALAVALLAIGAMVAIPAAAAMDGVPEFKSSNAVIAIFALAVFPTALTGFLAILVIQRAGASFMSLSNYLTPVCAVIFSVAILGESTSPTDLLSFALILSGVAITRIRARISPTAHWTGRSATESTGNRPLYQG